MCTISAALVIETWEPMSRLPPHQRLATLLAAANGAGAGQDDLELDTLGARNRRLLVLHQTLIQRKLEAKLSCIECHAENEFLVPVESMLAALPPNPQMTISLPHGSGTLLFRLPRMTDLQQTPTPHEIAGRCSLSPITAPLSEIDLSELALLFEAADPLADVVVDLVCAGCGKQLHATVDVAAFVARDLDRMVEELFWDVDRLARAYGWKEATILALPPARRRRYVAMVSSPPAASLRRAGRAA